MIFYVSDWTFKASFIFNKSTAINCWFFALIWSRSDWVTWSTNLASLVNPKILTLYTILSNTLVTCNLIINSPKSIASNTLNTPFLITIFTISYALCIIVGCGCNIVAHTAILALIPTNIQIPIHSPIFTPLILYNPLSLGITNEKYCMIWLIV